MRNPWVAALLTLALPGLGHVYAGDPRRGLTLLAAFAAAGIGSVLILLYLPVAPLNVVLPALLVLAVWLYILTDAFRRARTTEVLSPRPYDRWWVYVGAVAFVGFIAQPAARTLFEATVSDTVRISSEAMAPTLLEGDYLLVDKRRFRTGSPARFEVAVYRRGRATYLHRIAGVPGDTLEMIRKVLHLNGAPVSEPYVQHRDSGDVTAPAMLWQLDHLVDGEGGKGVQPSRDNWGPIVVPDGHYFMLGDNRDDSADSRHYGFVPRGDLLASALRLYFSMSADHGVRWDRIGQGIS